MNRNRWIGLIITGLVFGGLRLLFEDRWFSYIEEHMGDNGILWLWAGTALTGMAASLWFPLRKETRRTTLKIIGCAVLGVALSELVLAVEELTHIIGNTGITPTGETYSLYQYTAVHAIPVVAGVISVWGGLLGGALTLFVHVAWIGVQKARASN